MLAEQLTALNPDADRARMLKNRRFDANGLLEGWDLGCCNIAKLPETFGDILCTGDLYLNDNLLQSLPLSLATLSIGGELDLGGNNLLSLPPNFDQVRVEGSLYLHGNPELTGIPTEFPNVMGWVFRS